MANNVEDIRRETEERIRRRGVAQATQERRAAQNATTVLLTRLHEFAHRNFGNRNQRNLDDAKKNNWASQHPEFTESETSPSYLTTMTLFLLLIYPATYGLDVFLLSGNAKQIAKDFAQGNQYLIYAAIFAIPFVVLLIEAYFQTQWSVANTRGSMWLWGIASVLMCIAVPATIVGFSMATTTSSSKGGARAAQAQSWHLIGKAALALFAHFAILLGGRRLHEAKNYLAFKVKDRLYERNIKGLDREIQRDETALTNTFNEYYQNLNDFNVNRNENQIEHGPFDQITRGEINRLFGYEIIAAPQNAPMVDDSYPGNAPENAVDNQTAQPNNPRANTANPNQNNQPNDFVFDMDGEDEVRS